MAKGFSRRGRGKNVRYAARLDDLERALVVDLLTQVRELIDPGGAAGVPPERAGEPADAFDAIVAGLGSDFGARVEAGEDADSPALGGRGFGGADRDPALDRLFPAGHRTDEEAAREFRRFTEQTLITRKLAGIDLAIGAIESAVDDRVELSQEKAVAVLVALTDVRLVLGDRLGLREDRDAQRLEEIAGAADPQDPALYAILVYDFLTWLQETLATSMLPRG